LGGTSTGMEIWNPYDGTIQLILDVHPQEIINYGLVRPNLVAIKGKQIAVKCIKFCF